MTTFGELKCEVCGVLGSEVTLHRANPKGEKARWRCEPHLGKPIPESVVAVTDVIEFDNITREAP